MAMHWTDGAEGAAAMTNRRAKFHHGLVVIARMIVIQHLVGEAGEGLGGARAVTERCAVGG